MALETINARIECKKPVAQGQAIVEARIAAPQNVAIKKMLSCGVDVNVQPAEVFAKEARYGGKANFKCLVADASGALIALNASAVFSDKITGEEITATHKPRIYGKVVDTDIVSLTETEIRIAAAIDVIMFAAESAEYNLISEGSEDIYIDGQEVEYNIMKGESAETLLVADTLDNVKGTEVLFVHPRLIVKQRKASLDAVEIAGDILCEVCIKTEDGLLNTYTAVTEFSKEITVLETKEGDIVTADAAINSFNAEYIIDGEGGRIDFEYSLDICAAVFAAVSINAAGDAYCVENELELESESIAVLRNKLNVTLNESVDGSVTLGEDMPPADNVLGFLGARILDTNSYADAGKITIEGIISGDIIYYSAEKVTLSSITAELPFSLTTPLDTAVGDMLTVRGTVTEVNVKIKRENVLEIKAQSGFEINVLEEKKFSLLKSVQKGQPRPEPEGTVAIHIAKKGERLWDTAKALCARPDEILEQNPALTVPFKGGERVITFRHLK